MFDRPFRFRTGIQVRISSRCSSQSLSSIWRTVPVPARDRVGWTVSTDPLPSSAEGHRPISWLPSSRLLSQKSRAPWWFMGSCESVSPASSIELPASLAASPACKTGGSCRGRIKTWGRQSAARERSGLPVPGQRLGTCLLLNRSRDSFFDVSRYFSVGADEISGDFLKIFRKAKPEVCGGAQTGTPARQPAVPLTVLCPSRWTDSLFAGKPRPSYDWPDRSGMIHAGNQPCGSANLLRTRHGRTHALTESASCRQATPSDHVRRCRRQPSRRQNRTFPVTFRRSF